MSIILDKKIPSTTAIIDMITAIKMVLLNDFDIFNADIVGKIIKDDIKSDPNILIPNTIITDVSTNNILLYKLTLIPVALANSSSNVIANNLLYSSIAINITIIERTIDNINSVLLIANIEPNKYELISAFIPLVIDIKNIANAIEDDEIKPIAASPSKSALLLKYFINNDAITTIGKDINKVDWFNINANATAKKPTCDNPSPIIEYFLRTRNIPKTAEEIAISIPTTNAFWINPYEIIS